MDDFFLIFKKSVDMELLVSELYKLFFLHFPQDADFWWRLMLEEKNHAALIQSGLDFFHSAGQFPRELLVDSLETVQDANRQIETLISRCRETPVSRGEAFNLALCVESSSAEQHFQNFMVGEVAAEAGDIFRRLNDEDLDHARRIKDYMKANGIDIDPTVHLPE